MKLILLISIIILCFTLLNYKKLSEVEEQESPDLQQY
jgi:hypothetical protein